MRKQFRREHPARSADERARVRSRPQERERPHGDVIYGVEPVREMIAGAPGAIRSLHFRRGDERRFASEIASVRAARGGVVPADESELDRLAGPHARHQGILAMVREYHYESFDDLLAEKPDPLLLVDGVTDPRNLGALMRSAEGAGLRAIVIARDRTAAVTPGAIKSSAGAWVHLKVARCGNVARALEQLKQSGYWIAALAPGGNESIYNLDASRRLAIVIGSEDKGIRDIVRKRSDFVVSIPMRGKVGSLNVSVAAAVALYEIARRRAAGAAIGALEQESGR